MPCLRRKLFLLFASGLLALGLSQSQAQQSIDRHVIAGGGGTSLSGSLKVEGTIGQPAVGTTLSNGQFSQTGGFWQLESGAAPTPTPTPIPTPSPTPSPNPTPSALVLMVEEGTTSQAAAVEVVEWMRDPFPVVSGSLLYSAVDKNTRLEVFVSNLALQFGEAYSDVTVNLLANSAGFAVPAEFVAPVPNQNFAQVVFRLPDNLPSGVLTISVSYRGVFSNSGTIRVQ